MSKKKTDKRESKQESQPRTDLVTLTAPEGQVYTNADGTMKGKTVVVLKGYEDTLTLTEETTEEEEAEAALSEE